MRRGNPLWLPCFLMFIWVIHGKGHPQGVPLRVLVSSWRHLDFARHHFGNQRGAVFFLQFDDALGFSDFGIDSGGFGFDVVDDGGLFF